MDAYKMHGWEVGENAESAAAGITAGNEAWQKTQAAMAALDAKNRRN